MRFGKVSLLAGMGVAAFWAGAARAELSDWTVAPLRLPVGDAELWLRGDASGALFSPDQPGWDGVQASGALRLMPRLQRDYDSGLSLAFGGTFTAADPLSRGRYDGDAIEKLAAEARTGLGKITIGLADGAGYDLAVTGPKVDAGVSLDDPRTSFYRDPGTGRAVTQMFALRTEVGATSNYAKFVYSSPEVFGVALAVSFTPTEGKQLPFMAAGPHVPGRQADIWEAALRYSDDVGPVTLSGYGAVALGRGEHKLPGQEGVTDAGFGLRADYPINDEITVSLGGAYRVSNAHGFDINQSYDGAATRALQASAMVTDGSWSGGIEFGHGVAGAVPGLINGSGTRLGLNGMEASIGYALNSDIQVSGGWQRLGYSRGNGTFFNGSSRLEMDAAFIHLNFKTSEQ